MLDLFSLPTVDGVAVKRTPFVVVQMAGEPHGRTDPQAGIVRPRSGPMFISYFKRPDTRRYQEGLAKCANVAMMGKKLITGPVAVRCFAMVPVPKSWPNRDRDAALVGTIFPDSKPDEDNYMKNRDAFKGIVWDDDCRVCWGLTVKEYAEHPGIIFEIFLLP